MSRLELLGRILTDRQWLALDLETTGLSRSAEIVEIGMVAASGAEWSSLVQPTGGVPRAAERVHGLSEAQLAGAPWFDDLSPQVVGALSGRVVLGYHVDFDRRLLWSAFSRVGKPAPKCRWLCLSEVVSSIVGRRLTLAAALTEVGVAGDCFGSPHRALPDARRVAALARGLVEREIGPK